ncbi:MAG TPA: SMC-Scp complex subunit ScpB [Polyangia bacterium]|jgi:segregation and condensation protein B
MSEEEKKDLPADAKADDAKADDAKADDAKADDAKADDAEPIDEAKTNARIIAAVAPPPPADLDAAPANDDPVPPEATEDHPDDLPPDPGSEDAASPRLQSIVESLLFAADKPLTLKQLGDLLGESELARVRAAVAAVEVANESRGFQLHQVAGGYQFRTNSENAAWVQKLLASKPVRLTRAQIETLAICSYRQPVTRPEIDEIRGVDSGGTLKTLLDRSLIRIVGKKEEPGRPILYGTTREFLEFFNLRDLKDLPTLREFHELSEEHQAQVAALEGVAPEGSIEKEGEEPAPPPLIEGAPPLTRLEITTPAEDERELEEIDRLIRTAGVATDQDQPGAAAEADAAAGEAATQDSDFEHQKTREFEAVSGEPTRIHANTIPTPEIVDDEFDHSETTSKKPRPEGLDAADDDAGGESEAT